MRFKVLAINFGGLGDQILFQPSLEILENIFEKNKIFFMTETRAKNIAKLTNSIEEKNIIEFNYKTGNIFSIVVKTFEFIQVLRGGNYDYVFCTGKNPLIPLILFLSGIKHRYHIKSPASYDLHYPLKNKESSYVSRILFQPVESFLKEQGLDYKFKNPEIKLEHIEKQISKQDKLEQALSSNKKKIAIHPGTSKLSIEKNINKRWQVDKWVELIEEILGQENRTVYLCGGPEDKKICEEISSQLNTDSVINCHELLKDNAANLAYLFSKMDTIICLDSAPMHIAYSLSKNGEYLKQQIIALFSVTNSKNLVPEEFKNIKVIQGAENDWDIEKITQFL